MVFLQDWCESWWPKILIWGVALLCNAYYLLMEVRQLSEFFPKIWQPWDLVTLKNWIKTAITHSVFGRLHSCWHRCEAAITAHPTILTILVSTPYIRSSCLPSAEKVAWQMVFYALWWPHTRSIASPFTIIQSLQSKIYYHPSISIYNTDCTMLSLECIPSLQGLSSFITMVKATFSSYCQSLTLSYLVPLIV